MGALATEVFEIFDPVVEDAGKQLQLQLDQAVTVTADRRMLIQALANLIQNGIAYGGPTITLTATESRLMVSDDGEGVPSDQLEEILKPMVRLDAARHSEGSGLGLALVKAVADRHNAALNLSSNPPQGLTIELNFTNL